MKQSYHSNAVTNIHIRTSIQKNTFESNSELSKRYQTTPETIIKWKKRNFTQDLSSRPQNIEYGLTDLEMALACSVRKTTWMPLDEVFELLLTTNPIIKRGAVYNCLVRNNINTVPKLEKEKAKKFKAYKPGYLHIDVTYLPQIGGQKSYLFVAIDRATRVFFNKIYDNKTAQSSEDFFEHCKAYFPFKITHILTDNGLEFTNRLIKSKKGTLSTKPSLLDIKCTENNISHRHTQPCTPQTNGMVERLNGTIKNNTILKNTYLNKAELENDILQFMCFYNLYRRHGSLRKELEVKTPCDAIEKWWKLEPEIFNSNPQEFKEKLILLSNQKSQIQV